jgi:hypothetical protein
MALAKLDVARAQRWCADRTPADLRDQVRPECQIAPGHLTIVDRRPPWPEDLGPEWSSLPVARVRYTAATKTWTLYWPDRNSRFHLHDLVPPSKQVDGFRRSTATRPAFSGADQAQ